jgi:hypothetical protein
MMLKTLSKILLVVGLSGLVGCSLIQQIAATTQDSMTIPKGCPPVIPTLPGIDENNVVILHEKDQESLLIYFLEVERCSTSVWAM